MGGSSINLIVRHSRISNSNKKDIFHKFIYQNINYHVALCKTMENNIREKTPFGKNTKIVMIYNNVKKFEFEKIKNDKLVLLHTGRIAPGKGQVDAMRACEILYKKDIDFIFYIVGGFQDKYKDEFMKIYKNLKYKDKIILTGFSKEVEKYLQISDIFLFPSHGEGLGNSFLEALSAGLKCISYDNTVFPEFKELGFDFAMVKNKDINALSKALLSVANKSAKFNVFKNKEIIKENFSNEAEKYLEILV